MTMTDAWLYLSSENVYYNPQAAAYAHIDQATKQWVVSSASKGESSSSTSAQVAAAVPPSGRALEKSVRADPMVPQELENASLDLKSRYDDPELYAFPTRSQSNSLSPGPREPSAPTTTTAPTLRLVVLSTTPTSIPQGCIALFDNRSGGIEIGRDRILPGQRARLRIKEMHVSKCHACIWYDAVGGWQIVDLGSTLGTFIAEGEGEDGEDGKGKRLSEAKHASLPIKLSHLARLSIGQTVLEVHIHLEAPCEACQLDSNKSNEIKLDQGGISRSATTKATVQHDPMQMHDSIQLSDTHTQQLSFSRKAAKEQTRKLEMRALRAAFLEPSDQRTLAEAGYVDRSAQRRKLHPPAPPPLATPAVQERTQVDIGASLLQKQGWSPGAGLGLQGEGRVEPIRVEMLAKRAGLGTGGGVEVGEQGDWRDRGKQRRFDGFRE